jgi:methylmalonyl-CoA/ethylmalonyl-CoA epimerase
MRALGKSIVLAFACIGVLATVQQLRGQTAAPLAGGTFTHIGIVVRDVTKAAQMFADVYGATPPPTARVYDNNGRGIPFPPGIVGNTAASGKLMQFDVGTVRIELIEPVGGPTAWSEHLEKFGPGVHHLAFRVADVNEGVRALERRGGRWVMGEGGNSFAYVDMKEQLGFSLELGRQQPPAAAAPAPR